MNKKKNNKGFSLIELIIAIAILIILTGMLAPQFMKYIEKSREAKDLQTLDTVYSAVQGAIADEAAYNDLVEILDSKNINKKGGVKLETLMGTDTGKFGEELVSLLGKSSTTINDSFQSKLSTTDITGKGEVYVAIDNYMQVVVTFGTAADKPAGVTGNELTVGKGDFAETPATSSSAS